MKRFLALACLFVMFAGFVGCDAGSSSAPAADAGKDKGAATTGAEAK